jgi:SAM-dependent methyltransferase
MTVKDSIQRFSSRVDNYVRYRPGYPAEILDLLKQECGLAPTSVVADIGSGSGKLTQLFLDNGNRTFAVEPNSEMRAAAEKLLAGYGGFTSVHGSAEATTLVDDSADFVTAGQAAHWFDLLDARREFVRILRPGGWVVLVWNDRYPETPFQHEYEGLLVKYGTDYQEVRHDKTTARIGEFFSPCGFEERRFSNRQRFDYAGLAGRLLSSSYTPHPGDPRYAPMLSDLKRIFDSYSSDGQVNFDYNTQMFYGRLS